MPMKSHLLHILHKSAWAGLLVLVAAWANAQPVISSFSPSSASVSATVTISGSNFNSTASNNVVFFGAAKATVQSVQGSSTLTVTVPYGANYKYISVTNLATSLTAYSQLPFLTTYTPTGDDSFRAGVTVTNGATDIRYITIADLNSDGKPDLVVSLANRTLSVFPNTITSTTGVATFGTAVSLGTSGSNATGGNTVADIDGDGKPDIIRVTGNASTVSVHRNTTSSVGGTPTFATVVTASINSSPISVKVNDLDHNGKPDIVVVSNKTTSNLSILRNTSTSGTVSMAAFQTFSVGNTPNELAIGDLNADGWADVVIANKTANNVAVYKNTSSSGTISISSATTLTTGTSPVAIELADLDGDGKLDIVVANSGVSTISTFLNTSSTSTISFNAKVDYTLSASPSYLAVGDTDGDGKADVVVVCSGSGIAPILHNVSSSGSISFTGSTTITALTPTNVATCDLNADGKPDLAILQSATSGSTLVVLQKIPQSLTITSASSLAYLSALSVTVSRSVSPTSLGGEFILCCYCGFWLSNRGFFW